MSKLSFALVPFLALTMACSSEKPAPKSAASVDRAAPTVSLTPTQERAIAKAQSESGGGLRFDDEILRLCPGVESPKFDYDSARVRAEFRRTMVALADCMKDGGLKDRNLLLVGHADPRGEDDYNLALGGRRAGSVQEALMSLGVRSSRLDVTSRGELDAKGTEELSWQDDRRVDVKLSSSS